MHCTKHRLALAALAALAPATLAVVTSPAAAAATVNKAVTRVVTSTVTPGTYVAGDFHNHTTCSDGSLSIQKLVKKSTDTWGLDWFVQAGHGGSGNRNCTLVEDPSLATAKYPFTNKGPTTTWANSLQGGNADLVGLNAASSGRMWRWQALQSFSYPVMEDQAVNRRVPLFLGLESVVSGHEHTSMSVITGQMPSGIDTRAANGATLGNATALAKWSYCFDRGDTDNSRGGTNQWDCAIGDSSSYTAPTGNTFDATARKLTVNSGEAGHLKTVEAVKWMVANHPEGSYYVPAHLERAGPFNPSGSNGFNIEHLRNFNNAGPRVAFGFETQPGHGASSDRGEYYPQRNNIGGVRVDSVGGTTYGGTGVYGAQIGGVWDALLADGRRWWFFASSDWHNRGIFGADDRRTTQDFEPGEYQRNETLVRKGSDRLRPQTIVDGLRDGNTYTTSGQLIDRLAFVACTGLTAAQVQALAVAAASGNTTVDHAQCASMGQKLAVAAGTPVQVAIVVRDPAGTNHSPYTFANPSLQQVGITQPLNRPVLDHVDLIGGQVTSLPKTSADADYAGQWPNDWLAQVVAGTATLSGSYVPAAAKNLTAGVLATFSQAGGNWSSVTVGGQPALAMAWTIASPTASQYLRLRGTNLPAAVPWETDASGNPLPDLWTNASNTANLKIACTATGTVPPVSGRAPVTGTIGACPSHLPVVNGQKMLAYDVAAWADLWFYSNPIYIEVSGSTRVAGLDQ